MAVYLVTWDLNKEKPNYGAARGEFIARISRYEHIKDNGLDSVWFVDTSWSASEVNTDLKLALDDNDRLIVVQIHKNTGHSGWLHKDTWQWLEARM